MWQNKKYENINTYCITQVKNTYITTGVQFTGSGKMEDIYFGK